MSASHAELHLHVKGAGDLEFCLRDAVEKPLLAPAERRDCKETLGADTIVDCFIEKLRDRSDLQPQGLSPSQTPSRNTFLWKERVLQSWVC